MAAPNIVNVATITGVTTFIAGIAVTTRGTLTDGISTVVANPASSGKVLKINSLVAASIGATTGVTLQHFNNVRTHRCWVYCINRYDSISSTILLTGSD